MRMLAHFYNIRILDFIIFSHYYATKERLITT